MILGTNSGCIIFQFVNLMIIGSQLLMGKGVLENWDLHSNVYRFERDCYCIVLTKDFV